MDRQAHEYAAAAAFAQQRAAAAAAAAAAQQHPQQQFGGGGGGFQQFGGHAQLPPQFLAAQVHHHHHPHHLPQQFPPHPQQIPQQFPPPQFHPHPQQMAHPSPFAHIPQPPPMAAAAAPQIPQPFFNPWEQPPPPMPPPADPELQKRIDKLAEYAAKNGPDFEKMIREKQQDNPAYSFLFGGEGHAYYRYKLWLCTRPLPGNFGHGIPPSLSPVNPINPNVNPGLHSSPLPLNHGSPYPGSFYEQQQQKLPSQLHTPPIYNQTRPEYDRPSKSFKGLSGPLPSDVAAELNSVLSTLTGTKESIKGAKTWFMQRSPFAPALAEALKERAMALDDAEKQLHIIYLVNDILFDSLQRRSNPKDLDNEALAFQPVLGPMLAKIYHNPQNKEANQSRLQKLLQFWGSKEVYDAETIYNLESKMMAGASPGLGQPKDSAIQEPIFGGTGGIPSLSTPNSQWQPDSQRQPSLEKEQDKTSPASSQFVGTNTQFPLTSQPFVASTAQTAFPPAAQPFHASIPSSTAAQPSSQMQNVPPARPENQPPYPLFPPGLIPGMVRKMQIGSGVPYSPLSPLDIPTAIPPSTASPTYILERVSKFFKEIGEVNPLKGQSRLPDQIDDEQRELPSRTGGACIPPPPTLQADPETGMLPDGSIDHRPGMTSSGRLGLGASADPNEPSQYDDVYTSYRKQRSTSYHTSMSARASAR